MELPDEALGVVRRLQDEGKTVMQVACDGSVVRVLGAADRLRPDVRQAIQRLKALGIRHAEVLTGDDERAASAVARELGIAYRANLLPEDRMAVVREYQARGRRVVGGMVYSGREGTPVATRTLLTADDLLRLPKDGKRYELVKGELAEMAPPGYEHGEIAAQIVHLLRSYVITHQLGTVQVESGFLLSREPDTVRAPDVAFIARDRLIYPRPKGYYPGAPDVAIEILSPNDTFREVQERIEAWLSAGAKSVWLVDPDRRRVMVYAHPHRPQVLEAAETLSDPAIPGFTVRVADLFPEG